VHVRREIEHVLSENRQRAFRLIANNEFHTNPLIITSETRHGEIFKMRKPIRNFQDKLVDIHFRPCCIELKDSDMNQGGE
jgi:hypothetical protein